MVLDGMAALGHAPQNALMHHTACAACAHVCCNRQAVVLLVRHSAEGSVGLLLNRPTSMVLQPGRGGLRFAILGAPDGMHQVFAESRCVVRACVLARP
jgi:hypothetical protein